MLESSLHLLTSIHFFFHPSILKPHPRPSAFHNFFNKITRKTNKQKKNSQQLLLVPPSACPYLCQEPDQSCPFINLPSSLPVRPSPGFHGGDGRSVNEYNHSQTSSFFFFLLPSLFSRRYVKCYRCALADLDSRTSDQRRIPELCVRWPFALRMANY